MPVIEYGFDRMPDYMKRRSPVPVGDDKFNVCECSGCGWVARHVIGEECGSCGSDIIKTRMTGKEYREAQISSIERRGGDENRKIALALREEEAGVTTR